MQPSKTSSRDVHEPGFCNLQAGEKAVEAAVVTVMVTVWLGVPGVSVTDVGLVAGAVANVHVASDGSTGHWNPLTTSDPEVRFTAVTVRVTTCELPCDIVTVSLDGVIKNVGPSLPSRAVTFGVPSPVAKSKPAVALNANWLFVGSVRMPTGPEEFTGQSGLTINSVVVFCAWHGIAFVPTITSLNAHDVLEALEAQAVGDCAAATA